MLFLFPADFFLFKFHYLDINCKQTFKKHRKHLLLQPVVIGIARTAHLITYMQDLTPAKRDSDTGVFLRILQNF